MILYLQRNQKTSNMKTVYPTKVCESFNEWCAYIRECVNNAKASKQQEQQITQKND